MRVSVLLPVLGFGLLSAHLAVARPFVPPPPCGNGIIDPPEQCDDGNLVDGDGCSSICQFEGDASVFDGGDTDGPGDPPPPPLDAGDPDGAAVDVGAPGDGGGPVDSGGRDSGGRDASPLDLSFPDTGTRPDTGAPDSFVPSDDAGLPSDSGAAADTGLIGDLVSEQEDGCACSTAHAGQATPLFGLLFLGALTFRRRR